MRGLDDDAERGPAPAAEREEQVFPWQNSSDGTVREHKFVRGNVVNRQAVLARLEGVSWALCQQ